MVISKPPRRSTTRLGRRLRAGFTALALALFGNPGGSAFAKPAGINVLVSASVTEAAEPTMSVALWSKLMASYAGTNVIPFAGPGSATLDDCRKAGADFLIVAPFDLRPMLPGLANAGGRVAARTHISITNCITGAPVLERNVNFDSDPLTNDHDGDFESVPEYSWSHSVPAALGKFPIPFERVARVIGITAPLALVDIRSGARPGDGLRDFAHADKSKRATPITMTVTQVFDRYVEVMFSGTGDRPSVGDLVEPIPAITAMPSPTPTPAAAPETTPTPTHT